jgi:hypothetical protein
LIKAILEYADKKGRVSLDSIVGYFREFFDDRRQRGHKVEKAKSVYLNPNILDKEILHNILIYPYRRFESMSMMHHTKTLGLIQIDEAIWKHLTSEDKAEICNICDEKLAGYFSKMK